MISELTETWRINVGALSIGGTFCNNWTRLD